METIALSDAEARLRELLGRTARGEEFEITDNGRSLGKLVPPGTARKKVDVETMLERFRAISRMGGKVSKEELKAWTHEGHRF
jgi:prevent-host-death family protein